MEIIDGKVWCTNVDHNIHDISQLDSSTYKDYFKILIIIIYSIS